MAIALERTAYRHIELFANTCDFDEAERSAYLDVACAGDPVLRAKVGRMVAADKRNREDGFLESTAAVSSPLVSRPAARQVGNAPRCGDDSTPDEFPERHVVRSLLRKRMLPGTFVGLIGFGLFFIKNLVDGTYGGGNPSAGPQDSWWPVAAVHAGNVAIFAACAMALWWRGNKSQVWELRLTELSLLISSATFFAAFQYSEWHKTLSGLSAWPRDPQGFNLLDSTNDECTLRWFALILAFGAYAPNTWRRWGAVTIVLLLLPIAITFSVCRSAHVNVNGQLLDMAIWLLIAALLAASGPLGVNTLQRERVEARRIGPYRLGRILGRGSMGVVFIAEHWLHKGQFAVKLIVPENAKEPLAWERFKQEVETTAGLTHLNIAHVIDYGKTDDDIVYYSMEYLPGLSLQQIVRQHGPIPPGRVVHLLKQACSALGDAHRRKLVHRDVKPGNIMVCERGGIWDVVKVVDFGIAAPFTVKAAPCESRRLAKHNNIQRLEGTPAYMSPEQANGSELTAASDIYSLGATAYFMLTGQAPFQRIGIPATIRAHQEDIPIPPAQLRPDVPMDLQQIVLRCLEKEPASRFADVRQLENALGDCTCSNDWDNDRAMRWWHGIDSETSRYASRNSAQSEMTKIERNVNDPDSRTISSSV